MDPDLLFTSDEDRTFQYDNDLPSLSVPTLQHTLNRYLESGKQVLARVVHMSVELTVYILQL